MATLSERLAKAEVEIAELKAELARYKEEVAAAKRVSMNPTEIYFESLRLSVRVWCNR